jgi:UDP-GlcNAc:undecaprenyl-phosphate GlcNAc-1-phosphate transferase
LRELISFLVALGASAALTPLVIAGARRYDLVAQPQSARWHRRPTALFGGVAIFVSFVITVALFARIPDPNMRTRFAGLLVGATLMFLLGFMDDFLHLKPSTKLIGQVVAACVMIYSGVYFNILGQPFITIPLTVVWVVGITNAFNLLDNMDGLAAGIAAICSFTIFALNMILGVDQSISIVALIFCGALLGFLIYNFNPARIFMGDCGSMTVGFTMAGLSIVGTWEQASNVFLLLLVPVLILGVPIFDTTFVTVTRRLTGRRMSVGGRDHTSHRLVALGMSERRAVLILYAISSAFAIIAILSLRFDVFVVGTLMILATIVVFIFGLFLGQSHLYQDVTARGEPTQRSTGRGLILDTFIMHKRRIAEVLIDLSLFGVAFVSAYLIRFEGALPARAEARIVFALPIVVPIKLLTFWSFGLYRRVWAFVGVHDLVAIAKAVLTSSLVSIMVLWGLTRLEGYSRAAFLLDGILCLLFAAGSRILFRVFQETLAGRPDEGKRLLIVGAGQAGEIVLREIRREPSLGYRAVGFVDDDPDKWGRRIHGVRILGGRELIPTLGVEDSFDEILIAIPSLEGGDQEELMGLCRSTGKVTRLMQRLSSTFIH